MGDGHRIVPGPFERTASSPHRYPLQVLAGKEVANQRIRVACERHIHCLTLDDRYFDDEEWEAFVATTSQLHVIGGHELAGQPLVLLPWQCWVYGSILCWKWRSNGGRVYKQAFVEVGRGSGKTTGTAALFLHLAMRHQGADFVCLANTVQQARQAYTAIGQFAVDAWGDDRDEDAEKARQARFRVTDRKIVCKETNSVIRTYAAKGSTLDGLAALGYLVDESSEQTSDWMAKIVSALPKLRDAFMISITTPGGINLGRDSPYYQRAKLAHESIKPENWEMDTFAALFGIDEVDDVNDEACWIKGQPSLNHVIPIEQYRRIRDQYRFQHRLADFERFQLCRFTTKNTEWLPEGLWEAAEKTVEMPGPDDVVVAAVDFSKSYDLSSCAYCWWKGNRLQVRWHHWAIRKPAADIKRDYQRHLESWQHLENVDICDHAVQYDRVFDFLWTLKKRCRKLARIGYDALGGMQLNITGWGDIDEKYNPETQLPMAKVPQTITTIGPATYLIEGMLRSDQIDLQDCPVAEYAKANVIMESNVNGDRRPSKVKSGGIIDPVIALCMAGHCLIVENMQRPGAYGEGMEVAF